MTDFESTIQDFQNQNGNYNITLNPIEQDTIIDFRSLLSQQKKKIANTELEYRIYKGWHNDISMKLLYYEQIMINSAGGYFFSARLNSVIDVKLENISQNNWYKNLYIFFSDNTPMRINYTNLDVSLVPMHKDFRNYRKDIVITENGIEWSINLVNEETLQENIRSKIDNTQNDYELIHQADDYIRTESKIGLEVNPHHKYRYHHGEHVAHHRGRRDIDHVWEMAAQDDNIDTRDDILEVSSAGSSLTPWGDNIVNWIRNSILCRDSKNQDAVVDHFTMIQEINGKISEVEARAIEETTLLRALYQNLNSAEKELHEYKQSQYEYEEELSSMLLTLIKNKAIIKKECAESYEVLITEEINNEIVQIKQSIQNNELLNDNYTCEIQMLTKEQCVDDAITYIFYEDNIKALKEQIKNCEEEDIRLNNNLQALEAQKTKDYTESSLVRESISKLVSPLNVKEAAILQEEDALAIMHQNQQAQQQQIYHIKDQIKLKESLRKNLKCELNVLNQELEILHLENNYLLLQGLLDFESSQLSVKHYT